MSIRDLSMAEKAREDGRAMAQEGSILVICEEDCYKFLVDGFKYAAHTILERKKETFVIRKAREYVSTIKAMRAHYELSDELNFMEMMDSIYGNFVHIMIVHGKLDITKIRTEDLKSEKGISDWYFRKRGYFTGKKFGL